MNNTVVPCIFDSQCSIESRGQGADLQDCLWDITGDGIHQPSVFRVICRDLRLKCFKRRRAQELTNANFAARMKRAKLLLQNFPQSATDFCVLYWQKDFLGRFIWQSAERPMHSKCNSQNAICLHFLPYLLNIYRKFEFLVLQCSVATCL